MKYALINKDEIKVIFAALQIGVVKDKKDQIILAQAIGIMKALKPSEPVAWLDPLCKEGDLEIACLWENDVFTKPLFALEKSE